MALPRQLPVPHIPDTASPQAVRAYLVELHERLKQWTLQASGEFTTQFLQPSAVVPTLSPTEFTCPLTIATVQQPGNTYLAKAQLVVDGAVIPYTQADPPAPGYWTLRVGPLAQQQTIVVGVAPVTDIYLGFVVAATA